MTIAALRYLVDNVASGLTVVVTSRSQRGLPDEPDGGDELVEIDRPLAFRRHGICCTSWPNSAD